MGTATEEPADLREGAGGGLGAEFGDVEEGEACDAA